MAEDFKADQVLSNTLKFNLYANAAARNSAFPSPVEGQIVALAEPADAADAKYIQVYQNNQWNTVATINSGILTITGGEGEAAGIVLESDENDDAGDGWQIIGNDAGTGKLTFKSNQPDSSSPHDTYTEMVSFTANATALNSTAAFAGSITVAKDATITGNLTVNGTTTTVATMNTLVKDKLITINDGGATNTARGAGIEFEENNAIEGFMKTSSSGEEFEFKVPEGGHTLTLDINADKEITVAGDLNIEADSIINQDLSSDANVVFNRVTANGGLIADNLTLDGTTLALSSGDLTLDAAGDIILDAGGGDILFKKASAEYMRILDGGNVGIGTSSPATLVHVNKASGENELRLQSSNKYTSIIQKDNAELIVQNASSGPIIFYDNSAETMRIEAGGEVGIGTSGPIAKLDVAGKIAITSETTTPAQPADGKGYIYTKSDGKLYWRSFDIAEVDLTAAGGGSGDITGVVLSGDSGTASDNTGSADLTIAGGGGITTSAASATLTVAIDYADATNIITQATNGTGIGTAANNDQLLIYDTSATAVKYIDVSQLPSGGSSTLDQAYDQGGAGAGRIINIDNLKPLQLSNTTSGADSLCIFYDANHQTSGSVNSQGRFILTTYAQSGTNGDIVLNADGAVGIRDASANTNPKLVFTKDADPFSTGLLGSKNDYFIERVNVGGVDILNLKSNHGLELQAGNNKEVVVNQTGASTDFRVESNLDANALFVDGSADKVGIGVSDPDQKLEVAGAIHISGEMSAPAAPGDNDGGVLWTQADGKLYWRSHELSSATDLTAGAANSTNTGQFSIIGGSGATATLILRADDANADGQGDDSADNWAIRAIDGNKLSIGSAYADSSAPFDTFDEQLTFTGGDPVSNAMITSVAQFRCDDDLFIDDYIKHYGNATNRIHFETNKASFDCNNITKIFTIDGHSSQKEVVVNNPGANVNFRVLGDNDTHLLLTSAAHDRVGIGLSSPSAKLHVLETTDQLKLSYDGSNSIEFNVASNGEFKTTGNSSGKMRQKWANRQQEYEHVDSGWASIEVDAIGNTEIARGNTGFTIERVTGTGLADFTIATHSTVGAIVPSNASPFSSGDNEHQAVIEIRIAVAASTDEFDYRTGWKHKSTAAITYTGPGSGPNYWGTGGTTGALPVMSAGASARITSITPNIEFKWATQTGHTQHDVWRILCPTVHPNLTLQSSFGHIELKSGAATMGVFSQNNWDGSASKIRGPSNPPANASAAGTQGEIRFDANYVYICIATNTWKRTSISTW